MTHQTVKRDKTVLNLKSKKKKNNAKKEYQYEIWIKDIHMNNNGYVFYGLVIVVLLGGIYVALIHYLSKEESDKKHPKSKVQAKKGKNRLPDLNSSQKKPLSSSDKLLG